jgi:type IV pilus assembly protein PilW
VLLSAIVAGAIYSSYTSQRKIHRRQEAVVDMQQNSRAALYIISQELRMAGYDRFGTAGAGIVAANTGVNSIRYTQDLDDSGGIDPGEDITLAFAAPVAPATVGSITRDTNTGGGAQPFLNNVESFQLVYLGLDNTGNYFEVIPPITGANVDDIELIQISLLLRSSISEPELVNTLTFDIPEAVPGLTGAAIVNPIPAFNDTFRRRLVTTTI